MINFVMFLIGGTIYYFLEVLFRGYSHWTMFILGGLCFLIIGLLNETKKPPVWIQALAGSIIITVLEFVTGCIVNLWLGLDIWDYSDMPFNILGQVCLPFTVLWFMLSIVAVYLDDFIRNLLEKN